MTVKMYWPKIFELFSLKFVKITSLFVKKAVYIISIYQYILQNNSLELISLFYMERTILLKDLKF